jgi:hypothetical protein
VTIVVNGRPMESYVQAYVVGGRVFAPVDPLLARLADRLWYDGDSLVVERGSQRIRIRLDRAPAPFDGVYVAAAPVLRALGASLAYEARSHRLYVRVAFPSVVVSPTPFDPTAPSAPPSVIFTPAPPVTPRPLWTGSPSPRRTPLPVPPPPAPKE